jgi:hypothetical protein
MKGNEPEASAIMGSAIFTPTRAISFFQETILRDE